MGLRLAREICIGALVGWLAVVAPASASAADARLLLYDPDGSYGDTLEFSTIVTRFLKDVEGNWSFQAVADVQDFEALMAEASSHFGVISTSYVKTAPGKLQPMLVPTSHGDPFYRKVLIMQSGRERAALSGKSIAVTSIFDTNSPQARQIAAELAKQGVAGPVLVGVPQDIDALMALHLRQVDGALVTPGSLELLRRINPQAVSALHVVYEAKKVLRAPLCVIGTNVPAAEQALLRQQFIKMGSNRYGRQIMQRMGVDAWAPLTPEMMER
jgi:hypothetical protein